MAASIIESSIAPASRMFANSPSMKLILAPNTTMKPSAGSVASSGTENVCTDPPGS
ncbi:hypothetical protein D3C72_2035790 [compost metagenome]